MPHVQNDTLVVRADELRNLAAEVTRLRPYNHVAVQFENQNPFHFLLADLKRHRSLTITGRTIGKHVSRNSWSELSATGVKWLRTPPEEDLMFVLAALALLQGSTPALPEHRIA